MISFISSIDFHVLLSLYSLRDLKVTYAMLWLSQLGEWYVIGGLTCIVCILLLRRRHFAYAQGLALSFGTSFVATALLKLLVGRSRPPMEYWAYHESGNAFPSAHAALSLAFFGFLIYLISLSDAHKVWRILTIGLLAALTAAIGFSRLYLGVHYFSDVIGGFLLASACLWLGITTTRILKARATPKAS